ncbi:MAG TPA: hypothetical protein VGX23_12450 [Actinocrinis sp.]|nr:hypothetical protein [Actinocrinis sp.]
MNGTTGTCPTGGATGPASPTNNPTTAAPTTKPPTTPPTSPSTAPPGSGRYTEGASGSQLWFKPTGFTASSVYVHYTISGQSQLNYAMTWNASAGEWQQPISMSYGQTVTYSFDYTPIGQSYQDATPSYTFTD